MNLAEQAIQTMWHKISAPLIPLLILAVFLIITFRRDRWGTIAIGGIILSSILFTVAGSQEPILWRTLQSSPFGAFETLVVGLGITGILLSLFMVMFSVQGLLARIGASKSPEPA